jgi:hypothetical protein
VLTDKASGRDSKMASDADDAVEEALNLLVNVTEKSVNLRNNLRKDILQAVSNLRKEFAKLMSEVEDINKVIECLEMKAEETNSIFKALECGEGDNCREDKDVTSVGLQVTPTDIDLNRAPLAAKTRKRYSVVVAGRQGTVSYDHNMYKLFV